MKNYILIALLFIVSFDSFGRTKKSISKHVVTFAEHKIQEEKISAKQAARNKKSKLNRDYFNSVKGRLNTYLTDTLNKLWVLDKNLNWHHDFNLVFTKNNKLSKVIADEEHMSEAEKNQSVQLKQQIFNAFKSIHIDFVHTKLGYWRLLFFQKGKIVISGY